MKIETLIGLRYLRSKRKEAFIAFTTWIAISGIAIGVMALIVVIGVMTGFQEEIRNRILGINPHILILSLEGEIKEPERIVETIKTEEGIVNAFPFVQFQGLIQSRRQQSGVIVRGINPDDGYFLRKMMRSGGIEALNKRGNVIIGKELSRQLGLFVGETFYLMVPYGSVSPTGLIPDTLALKVGGIIETGIYDLDSYLIIMALKDVRELTSYDITGIEVRLKDADKAARIRDLLLKKLGPSFFARTWVEMNKNLFSALKLEKIAMFIILALIIFVASFNIVSSLVMTVMEKKKDIAILKSFGAKRKTIMKIFIVEGVSIGIVGAVFGSIFGYGLCEIMKRYKIISLPQEVYYISSLPVRISFFDVALISIVTMAICVLSTIYPSYKASMVDPVETLRYE